MIRVLLEILLALGSQLPSDLAAGSQRTAPSYLNNDTAQEHATAAVIAGVAYDVPPELLLSIAFYESRYQQHTVTEEPLGKVSCGVMTPVPIYDRSRCTAIASSSTLVGYLQGAQHLRVWIDASRGDMRRALLGYAGGYRLLRACADGPVIRQRGNLAKDLCETPNVRRARATAIRQRGVQG